MPNESRRKSATKTDRPYRVGEAVVVASAPVAAYLVTLAYMAGQSRYFGFPLELISVDLPDLFIAAGTLLVVGATIWQLARSAFMVRPLPRRASRARFYRKGIARRIINLLSFVLAFLPLPVLYRGYDREVIVGAIVIAALASLYAFFTLGLPWLNRSTSFSEKIAESEKRLSQGDVGFDLLRLRTAEQRLGVGVALALFVVALTSIYSFIAGRGEATSRERYYVISGEPPLAVLRLERDKVIASAFDKECGTLEGPIKVLRFGPDALAITPERVGPLRPGPCPSPSGLSSRE